MEEEDDDFWALAASQADAIEESLSQGGVVSGSQPPAPAPLGSLPVDSQAPAALEESDDFWALAAIQADAIEVSLSQERPNQPSGTSMLSRGAEWDAIMETELQRGELMTIVAAAGAGKSTVLREYARQRPQLRCLYITYNKDVKQEKQAEFAAHKLGHVTVRTTHSVAYDHTRDLHRGSPADECHLSREVLSDIMRNEPAPRSRSSGGSRRGGEQGGGWSASHIEGVKETLGRFCASTDRAVEAAHVPPSAARDLADPDDVLRAARVVWRVVTDPVDRRVRVWHDGYYKLFSLSDERQAAALQPYELLMLDEGHDCTAAQMSLLGGATSHRRIVVYDPHQAIYAFRYASGVAALATYAAVAERMLSQSWRYGEPLAVAATLFLNGFKRRVPGHRAVAIRGDGRRHTRLCERRRPPFEEVCRRHPAAVCRRHPAAVAGGGFARPPLVVLARSNRTILETAGDASGRGLRLHFPGGSAFHFLDASGGGGRLKDLHRLCCGRPLQGDASGIGHFLHKFASGAYAGGWDGYKRWLERLRDDRVRSVCEFVEAHKHDLPQLVDRIEADTVGDPQSADVLFSTAHKAKGLGWAYVYLCDDFLGEG